MNLTPKQVRESIGLSINEIARAMGVHRQTWIKWERGERKPDNAAAQFMGLLCWLHDNRGQTLTRWMKEI